MTAADNIRNNIIDKLMAISNRDYLSALYQLLDKSGVEGDVITLSEAQLHMLNMSGEDIRNNQVVLQEEADKRDLEWLETLSSGLKQH